MSGRSNSPWANKGRGAGAGAVSRSRHRGAMREGVADACPGGGGTRWTGAAVAALALLALGAAVGVWWTLRDGEAERAPAREERDGGGAKRAKALSSRQTEKPATRVSRKAVALSDAGAKGSVEGDVAEGEKPAATAPAATNAAVERTRPKRIFNNGLEQVAGWFFTARLGDMPPLLPDLQGGMTAERLEEILSAPNPVLEGDSEREADIKRTVAEAKRALAEYLKAGGDVQGFFEHYRGLLMEAHKTWQTNQKAMMRAFRENPEEAPALVRRLNEEMAERGIKPLTVPPVYRELMDAEEE